MHAHVKTHDEVMTVAQPTIVPSHVREHLPFISLTQRNHALRDNLLSVRPLLLERTLLSVRLTTSPKSAIIAHVKVTGNPNAGPNKTTSHAIETLVPLPHASPPGQNRREKAVEAGSGAPTS